jgi:hypothetical protein
MSRNLHSNHRAVEETLEAPGGEAGSD